MAEAAAAGGGEVRVLGAWASPFVIRVRIALNIKSVAYEFIEDLKMGVKSDLLLKSNPVHKKIPVLIHVDKPISESLVIVQYVDEVWTSGRSILPSDPYDRAIARFWTAYIDDKWFPSLHGIAKAQDEEAMKSAFEQVIDGLLLLEGAFVETNKGSGDFFGGEKIGYIDVALGCFLGWIRATEKMNGVKLFDEAKVPNLSKWAEKFASDPAVKDLLPETDKLVEFAKVLFAKSKAPVPPSTHN
ncbi:glutathione S-transferase U17-like [Impatiens glandulifera]|uniref:glutathione S-transferase U17-like n=1 Tax=Impatiens glandulifera TaxID=253017 RepID=UPI001FB06C41|nr:glutathione S-transferase U17-like [Impatiens glandulifera]